MSDPQSAAIQSLLDDNAPEYAGNKPEGYIISSAKDMSRWMGDADQTIVEHQGENPNYRTEAAVLPKDRTAICLLSNGTNTNINLVLKVKDILDGNLSQSYEIGSTQLMDIVLSTVLLFSWDCTEVNPTLDWSVILVWETYSVLTAFISAVLLIAGVTWFVYSYRYKD